VPKIITFGQGVWKIQAKICTGFAFLDHPVLNICRWGKWKPVGSWIVGHRRYNPLLMS